MHIQDLLSLPITCPEHNQEFERGNFVVQISSIESFQEFIMTKLTNKATRQFHQRAINILNHESNELQRRWEIAIPKIAKYLEQVESKILKVSNKNDTYYHEDNPTHNAMFTEYYTTIIGRLLPINPFLEGSFIKFGTDIAYSEEVCAFIDVIPKIGKKL